MTAGELAAAAPRFMHVSANEGTRVRSEEGSESRARAGSQAGGTFAFWPRAATLLARQALEQGLDDIWGAVAPPVGKASLHAQLLCLGAYVSDEELVSGVRHAWHGLSRACHHQVYELPPAAAELERWLDAVERLVAHDPRGR